VQDSVRSVHIVRHPQRSSICRILHWTLQRTCGHCLENYGRWWTMLTGQRPMEDL